MDALTAFVASLVPTDANTLLMTLGGLVLALIWGVWDRIIKVKRQERLAQRAHEALLARTQVSVVEILARDRDYQATEKHDCIEDRDIVWEAFASYAHKARDLRHEAAAIITKLAIELGRSPGDYALRDLPSIRSAYESERLRHQQSPANGDAPHEGIP